MPQAATIIDLASFRQERERARRRPTAQSMAARAPTIWMPVYVAFVPVWPVA